MARKGLRQLSAAPTQHLTPPPDGGTPGEEGQGRSGRLLELPSSQRAGDPRPAAGQVNRFIPTGVGRLGRRSARATARAVHPHGCGAVSENGSTVGRATVHLHGCGAVLTRQSTRRFRAGSSPRVWGGFGSGRVREYRARFIPTGVGRLRSQGSSRRSTSVHPHGCGAVTLPGLVKEIDLGSSPRVWGGYQTVGRHPHRRRFIPTGVGRLTQRLSARGGCPVHPHGCGAVGTFWSRSSGQAGSSPRVWGGCRWPSCGHRGARFIPTGVGRFSRSRCTRTSPTVHPHGCGAVAIVRGEDGMPPGSSPRVWGGSRRKRRTRRG